MKKVLLISIIILMTGCKATYRDDGREITWLDRAGAALQGFAGTEEERRQRQQDKLTKLQIRYYQQKTMEIKDYSR